MIVTRVERVDAEDFTPGTVLGASYPLLLELLHNSQKIVGATEVQRGATPCPGSHSCSVVVLRLDLSDAKDFPWAIGWF